MPPQQTNITSEAECDAAGLGLDLPIALAKDAMDEALACRNASLAALSGALSEKDAAGPTAASTRSVLSLLKQYWRALQERRQRQSALLDLSDRGLMDIGLTRGEIDCIAPQRAIDRLRDSATYPWSRGVM